jgi:hypothetical protein
MESKLTAALALLFLLCFGLEQQALSQTQALGVQANNNSHSSFKGH